MTPSHDSDRAERALRAWSHDYPHLYRLGYAEIASLAIKKYEAELAADLENDRTIAQIVTGFLDGAHMDRVVKITHIDESMRDALKSILLDADPSEAER